MLETALLASEDSPRIPVFLFLFDQTVHERLNPLGMDMPSTMLGTVVLDQISGIDTYEIWKQRLTSIACAVWSKEMLHGSQKSDHM